MLCNLLSFDVSSVSTGWAYFKDGKLKKFGVITSKNKKELLCDKIKYFWKSLDDLFAEYSPDVVLIEETYMKNVVTLKKLVQYVSIVLEISCHFGIEPIFISPNTVRSYFKVKKKEDAYDYVVKKYKSKFKNSTFEKDNDITDSVIQGLYYIEKEKSNE